VIALNSELFGNACVPAARFHQKALKFFRERLEFFRARSDDLAQMDKLWASHESIHLFFRINNVSGLDGEPYNSSQPTRNPEPGTLVATAIPMAFSSKILQHPNVALLLALPTKH
jgi:hypothetical protein